MYCFGNATLNNMAYTNIWRFNLFTAKECIGCILYRFNESHMR